MDINYSVPIEVMRLTKEFLVTQGRKNNEAFVLWKGKQKSNNSFLVTGLIIPDQIAVRSPFGYSFDLPKESVTKVINQLQQSKEMGLIQVHSHPNYSAIHSVRDDKLSLLGRKGSLSIVLPYFGNVDFTDFSRTKVHILTGINKWEILSQEQVNKMLTVVR